MRMWIGEIIASRPLSGIPSGHNPFPPAFPWGGAPRSELKSNNCQWQLLHNVKVARASPASARRMRATCLSPWERCPAGAERACLPSQSLRDSSPRVGAKGRTDCHTSDVGHWFAMTCAVRRFLKNFVRPHPPDRHLSLPREGFSPFTLHSYKPPPGLNAQAGRRLRYSLFISLDRVLK